VSCPTQVIFRGAKADLRADKGAGLTNIVTQHRVSELARVYLNAMRRVKGKEAAEIKPTARPSTRQKKVG
jgi:hypothetical protein